MRYLFYGGFAVIALVIALFTTNPVFSRKPVVQLTGTANSLALQQIVNDLSSTTQYRNVKNMKRLNEVADFIFGTLEKLGMKPWFQEYEVDGEVYKNVVVRFESSQKKNLIILGAHYDVCFETPGADDNASGVAGLLELARLIQMNEDKLLRPVELVFFTLEEPPHFRTENMGSAIHAKSVKAKGEKVDLMLSLEMIGRFSDEPGSQKYPVGLLKLFYPSTGNFLALVGRPKDWFLTRKVKPILKSKEGVDIRSINAPTRLAGIDFSDHLNYWKEGLPALMVTDTAFLRNFDYHKLSDTADKLDYKKMAAVVDQVLLVPFEF